MIRTKMKYHSGPLQGFLCIGLLLSCFSVQAAFFDDVDTAIPTENPDGSALVLRNSITSPDGRFTYLAGSKGIFIFSRDTDTGGLIQTGVHSGASYPGGDSSVTVRPEHLLISPDGEFLYMAGLFGRSSIAEESDAPIQRQYTAVKFNRDSETGSLTYNSHVDETQNISLNSHLALSNDGRSLIYARLIGRPGIPSVYLVNTLTMETQFILKDEPDEPFLPKVNSYRIALSPDENSIYLAGLDVNQNRDPLPAFAVIDFDRDANRLSVRQTLVEDYYDGLDSTVDVSSSGALHDVVSIIPSDDGKYVYTFGAIRTATPRNRGSLEAISVWRVEADGTLSLVRTMDKQELVHDVIGGEDEFTFSTDIELSADGNHFLYAGEDTVFQDEIELTVFARDSETGLLTYIDDNAGVINLDGVEDISIIEDGRYINLTQFGNDDRNVVVIDTAVDRTVTLNILESIDTQSTSSGSLTVIGASLQAIVSNNGPTDDYEVDVLIEKSDNMTLSTEDANCTELNNGNILCSSQNLLVGNQASFDIMATSSQSSTLNEVTATASSNKFDLDSSNDADSVDLSAGSTNDSGSETNTDATGSSNTTTTSGGGCSILGPRVKYDFSFLILLLVSTGIFYARAKSARKISSL